MTKTPWRKEDEHVKMFVQARQILDLLPPGFVLTESEKSTLDYMIKNRVVWGNKHHELFFKNLNARISLYTEIDLHGMRRGDLIKYFRDSGYSDIAEILNKRG